MLTALKRLMRLYARSLGYLADECALAPAVSADARAVGMSQANISTTMTFLILCFEVPHITQPCSSLESPGGLVWF